MNFKLKIDEFYTKQDALLNELKSLESAYLEAEDFTNKFLDECEKRGIELVSIQTRTDLIPASMSFPFGTSHSVFAPGKYDGWPAIWRVVEALGISGGCGNTDQMQISRAAQSLLIDGVYTYKSGAWRREE